MVKKLLLLELKNLIYNNEKTNSTIKKPPENQVVLASYIRLIVYKLNPKTKNAASASGL